MINDFFFILFLVLLVTAILILFVAMWALWLFARMAIAACQHVEGDLRICGLRA